jgi:hypothetical protein
MLNFPLAGQSIPAWTIALQVAIGITIRSPPRRFRSYVAAACRSPPRCAISALPTPLRHASGAHSGSTASAGRCCCRSAMRSASVDDWY